MEELLMREILLNPGPVSLSERVRRAAVSRDLCHREVEFFELQDSLREGLLDVYGLDPGEWVAILLAGSGTAALEAMVSTLLPAKSRLLVIENGVYGERITAIANVLGIDCRALHFEWGAPINIDQLTAALDAGPPVSHLAVVHHETTTGRLNDLAAVTALCSERGIEVLADAVSSFAAEEINFASGGLSAIAATANKCLHGIPGTAFVICRREALQNTNPRSLYLDLVRYAAAQDQQSVPFTPAVPSCLALAEALSELQEQGGWQARREHYRNLQQRIEKQLESLGVMPLLPADESSVVLRAYYLPEGMDYEVLHDRLKFHGFIIYSGQGDLARQMFRISTMGDITEYDMNRLQGAIKAVLADWQSAGGI
jgi:2-aminoethylphosphonate-pyruvate transaminase